MDKIESKEAGKLGWLSYKSVSSSGDIKECFNKKVVKTFQFSYLSIPPDLSNQ